MPVLPQKQGEYGRIIACFTSETGRIREDLSLFFYLRNRRIRENRDLSGPLREVNMVYMPSHHPGR